MLLRVVEPIVQQYVEAYIPADIQEIAQKETEDYLAKVVDKMKESGIAARAVVATGKADEVILDYARQNRVDLIIMSTHGRSGISRWVMGSVTDRVLRHSAVPVLTVSPAGCRVSM